MSILNHTTKVPTSTTVGQVTSLLGEKGAQSVSAQYENREPTAVFFSIDIHGSPVNFRLPCNWEGVLKVMTKDKKIPRRCKTPDQAKRVAWRIVKDWVEAQLAIIEAGQADMAEVFMPYAVTATGQTFYQRLAHNPQLLLAQ